MDLFGQIERLTPQLKIILAEHGALPQRRSHAMRVAQAEAKQVSGQVKKRRQLEFMKLILLLTIGAITSASVMVPAPAAKLGVMAPEVRSHCAPEEKIVFSCATTKAKVISICSSSALTSSDGYLQYRFGPANRQELVYPATKEHPNKHFQFGTQMYSGGGSAFLKFMNGEYTYTVFDAIGKGERLGEVWRKAGVVVSKAGKRITYLTCEGEWESWQSNMSRYEFEKIKIPEDPNEAEFEVP